MTPPDLTRHAAALIAANGLRAVSADDLALGLSSGDVRWFSPGSPICQEGAESEGLLVLLHGTVSVTREDAAGWERVLAMLTAPTVLGQVTALDRSPRSASITADTDVTMLCIGHAAFDDLMSDPMPRGFAVRQLVLTTLCRQVVGATECLIDMSLGRDPDDPATAEDFPPALMGDELPG